MNQAMIFGSLDSNLHKFGNTAPWLWAVLPLCTAHITEVYPTVFALLLTAHIAHSTHWSQHTLVTAHIAHSTHWSQHTLLTAHTVHSSMHQSLLLLQGKIMDVYGEMKTALDKLPEASTSAGSMEKQCEKLKSESSLYRTELMNVMDFMVAIRNDLQEKVEMLNNILINLSMKTDTPFPKESSNLTMPSFPPTTPREGQPTLEDTPNTVNCDPEFCDKEGGNTPTQCTTTPILQRSAIHSTHCSQPLVRTTTPQGATFTPHGATFTPHGAAFTPQGVPSTPHGAAFTPQGVLHKTTPHLHGAKHPLMKTTSRHGDSSIPHQLMQTYRGGTPVLKDIAHPLKKTTSHHGTTPTPQDVLPNSEGATVTSSSTTPTLTKIHEKQYSADSPTAEEDSPPRSPKSDAETTSQSSQSGKNSRSDHRRKQSQTRDPPSFLPQLAAVYSQKSPLLKDSKQSYLPKLPKRKTM